jgi:hypothetical protein
MSRIVLVITLLVLAVTAGSASAASVVSGGLSDRHYHLVLLQAGGKATPVKVRSGGRFTVRVPSSKGATLHLLRDGRYAGPVVLRGAKPRLAFPAAKKLNLGTVKVTNGYATTSRSIRGSGPAIRTTTDGRPIGAGKLGLVRVRRARAAQAGETGTEGSDTDLDGVPNAFDADDDGDLKLDNIEGSTPAGPHLEVSSALPLEIADAMNANAGADADRETVIRRFLRLLFLVSKDTLGDAQRVGVACGFSWCDGAQVVIPPGTGDSTTPWSDGDGDGLRDLVVDGPVFTRQIYPRAATTEIQPGDTFTATTDRGQSAITALAMYFTSSIAVKTIGTHTINYPAEPGSPGSPGNPITIPRRVRIILWRPQRAAIPGAETGTLIDIGGLSYGVDVNGSFCRAGDFSDLSETLEPGSGDEAPLKDSAADAQPSGATISFTVDTAACAPNPGGSDTGGGGSLVSVVAKDETGDLTRQHISVQFEG